MKPSEEQWNRWIDGELSPEEVEALKAASAEEGVSLEQDQAFFGQLSQDLKATFPAEQIPPFADFFNSHIQHNRIAKHINFFLLLYKFTHHVNILLIYT